MMDLSVMKSWQHPFLCASVRCQHGSPRCWPPTFMGQWLASPRTHHTVVFLLNWELSGEADSCPLKVPLSKCFLGGFPVFKIYSLFYYRAQLIKMLLQKGPVKIKTASRTKTSSTTWRLLRLTLPRHSLQQTRGHLRAEQQHLQTLKDFLRSC